MNSIKLNQHDLAFVKENFKEQISALKHISPIINDAISAGVPEHGIRLGGGTALAMFYFHHRKSFDLDFFVTDQQYMSYLNPALWLEDYSEFNDSEYTNLFNHIAVTTKDGISIDFLNVSLQNNSNVLDAEQFDFIPLKLHVETIDEIIAKKIVYRKKDNKTRDIVDLAFALENEKGILARLSANQMINPSDIVDLRERIVAIDKNKFFRDLEIISPTQNIPDTFKNAIDIVLEGVSNNLKIIEGSKSNISENQKTNAFSKIFEKTNKNDSGLDL